MGATFCQVNRIKIYFVTLRVFWSFFLLKRKMPLSKIVFADEKTEKNAKNQHRKYKKSIQKPHLKKQSLKRGKKLKKVTSRSISRVLSCATIYLLPPLPTDSSDVNGDTAASNRIRYRPILLRVGFTRREKLPPPRWAFTSPFHPYRKKRR